MCCNDEGVAEFQQLRQKRQHAHCLTDCFFDLLELNGADLRRERRAGERGPTTHHFQRRHVQLRSVIRHPKNEEVSPVIFSLLPLLR